MRLFVAFSLWRDPALRFTWKYSWKRAGQILRNHRSQQ